MESNTQPSYIRQNSLSTYQKTLYKKDKDVFSALEPHQLNIRGNLTFLNS